MKQGLTKGFFMLCLALLCGSVFGIPASQKPVKATQPDGSVLTIIIKGDEFQSWITTLDGYSIQRNAEGYFEYVKAIEDNQPVLSGIRVQESDQRKGKERRFLQGIPKNLRPERVIPEGFAPGRSSHGNAPKGVMAEVLSWRNNFFNYGEDPNKINGILVPVNFPDCPLTYSQGAIDSIMNVPGYNKNGAKGSVRDYFEDMSQGKFLFHMEVLPPYTASNGRTYYGKYGPELKTEVYNYIVSLLGDHHWEYDMNQDEHIDHISIIFAGMGQETDPSGDAGLIWSHNGYSTSSSVNYRYSNISCIAEIDNFDGVQGIETYCHEFGHALGLPDFYNTGSSAVEQSLPDQHELMSANTASGHPVPMSAFSRWILGWTGLKTISAETPGTYSLQDMLLEEAALRYYTKTPGEFFILENRTPLNIWQDREDLGHGLLIFKVDSIMYMQELQDNTVNDYERQSFQLLRADNDNSYSSPQGDYFPYGGLYTEFTDESSPASLSYNGLKTELPVTGITEEDNIIRFTFVREGSSLLSITSAAATAHDGEWGHFIVKGEYLATEGVECTEAGICYGRLPLPTVSGNKASVEDVAASPSYEVLLDLSSFAENATVYYRAYAVDDNGNTVYGDVHRILMPQKSIVVETEYVATTGNGGITKINDKQHHVHLLDISRLPEPMAIVNGPEIGIGWTTFIGENTLQVSSDGGKSWSLLHPDGVFLQAKGRVSSAYRLPDASDNYLIAIRCEYLSDNDTVIIRSGSPYNYIPLDSTLYFAYEEEGGNYPDNWGDVEGFRSGWKVYSANTSQTSFPVARIKRINSELQYLIYVKTQDEKLAWTVDGSWTETLSCPNGSLNYQYISRPDSRPSSKQVALNSIVPLPVDECAQIFCNSPIEVEVTDIDADVLSKPIKTRAVNLNTVEVEIINWWQDGNGIPLLGEERGLCWSTENTPSTQNSIVLPSQNYVIQPVTQLPDQTVYFWTYMKKGGEIRYSEVLVSEVQNGQRANQIENNGLNSITPIGFSADELSLKVRVEYPSQLLEGAVAQGICHDWDVPDINTASQYHEGNIVAAEYYDLSYASAGYSFNIRPFTMKEDGSIVYGEYIGINSCRLKNPPLSTSKRVFAAPCNLISEAALAYPDGSTGFDYWTLKRPTPWDGFTKLRYYNDKIYMETSAGEYVLSPIIDLSACINPTLNLRCYNDTYSEEARSRLVVSTIHAVNGQKHILDTLHITGSYNNKELFQVSLEENMGDSVYLCLEKLNSGILHFIEMEVADQLAPQIASLPSTDDGDTVYLHGKLQTSELIPEATEYGFIYSHYGDPLTGMENQSWEYWRIPGEATDTEGNFSASFEHEYLDYIYARAYATNANGTSYGDCMSLLHCGEYILHGESLPIDDPKYGTAYNMDGSSTSISPSYSCPGNTAGEIVVKTGILQLNYPPAVNKIHAFVEWDVTLFSGDPAAEDPENLIMPYFQARYRTEGSSEWLDLPAGYELRHDANHTIIGGEVAVFQLEADLPRNYAQMEFRFVDNPGWDFGIKTISYSESDEVDNFVAVPSISNLSVEDGHIALYWGIDSWDNVESVRIYREGNTVGTWDMVEEIYSGESNPVLNLFVDNTSTPATRAYTYEVRSVNNEGDEFASSRHRSMHLTINKGIQNQWNLMWNYYEGREVSAVRIYRGSDAGSLEMIDQIAGNTNSYTDVNAPEGDVYYQIETLFASQQALAKGSGNLVRDADAGIKEEAYDISRSNIATNAEVLQYTITVGNMDFGRVEIRYQGELVSSGSAFDAGTVLDLEAIPDQGYEFTEWMDGSKDNPYSFVLNEDTQIRAYFKPKAGNENVSAAEAIKIYPNPMEDKLHILSEIRILHGELRNIQGAVLLQFDDVMETVLPVDHLPSGVYFLFCQTESGAATCKLIKQ